MVGNQVNRVIGDSMKKETVSDASATVKDYSNGADGSKEIDLTYTYDYDVLENDAELRDKFAPADLLALANARIKSTANSAARQKAIAPYAQDPNSPAAVRETLIKNAMKIGKTLEQATAFVDSLFAS
jgi:hypothetical protein